jgi:hypothetical protein
MAAANTGDKIVASDIYGSRVRLNPNSDERSYATRLFRVRLNPSFTDDGSYDAPFDVAVGKHKRAIIAAVGAAPGNHPTITGLACQDVNARQIGPFEFEVQADYFRVDSAGLSGANQSMTVTMRQGTTTVYRTPYLDNGNTQFADSLPNGNFAGLGDNQELPRGANYQSWQYEYPVTEALVAINAKLNITQYSGLWEGSGCMKTLVGVYNSNAFEFEQVTFPVGTLKFVGASATVQAVGATREYFVNYQFLWRPNGWFRQELTTSGATAGFFVTNNVNGAFPQSSYADKFPTS